MAVNASNLIWVDLEMTGLDPEHDRIIEMAAIVTDMNLNTIAESPVFAIHQSNELLDGMDEWNTKHHNESGLVQRVRESVYDEAKAEAEMLKFCQQFVPAGKSPLCGNSVWQDRRFLAKYMSSLEQFFHYRLIDVSTLKELARLWAPEIYNGHKKKNAHLAMDDIRESIEELKYYRANFLQL